VLGGRGYSGGGSDSSALIARSRIGGDENCSIGLSEGGEPKANFIVAEAFEFSFVAFLEFFALSCATFAPNEFQSGIKCGNFFGLTGF
jgi:hypothetical protein